MDDSRSGWKIAVVVAFIGAAATILSAVIATSGQEVGPGNDGAQSVAPSHSDGEAPSGSSTSSANAPSTTAENPEQDDVTTGVAPPTSPRTPPVEISKIQIDDYKSPDKIAPDLYRAQPGRNADFSYIVRVTSGTGAIYREGCYFDGKVVDTATGEIVKSTAGRCSVGTFAAVPAGQYRISVTVTLDSGTQREANRDFVVVN